MSLHSDLEAAWPADLVTAGVVASASQVYFGEEAARVIRGGAVDALLTRLDLTPGGHGLQSIDVHRYRLRLRKSATKGPDGSWKSAQDELAGLVDAVRARYHGKRPFVGVSALASVFLAEVADEGTSLDEQNDRVLEARVRVHLHVKG